MGFLALLQGLFLTWGLDLCLLHLLHWLYKVCQILSINDYLSLLLCIMGTEKNSNLVIFIKFVFFKKVWLLWVFTVARRLQ